MVVVAVLVTVMFVLVLLRLDSLLLSKILIASDINYDPLEVMDIMQ